jgi:hypothetical protein
MGGVGVGGGWRGKGVERRVGEETKGKGGRGEERGEALSVGAGAMLCMT